MRYLLPLVTLLLCPLQAVGQDYYADVRPLLVENCLGCHSEDGIAFSMEHPEEAWSRRRAIGRMVTDRRMPPWLAEAGHQRYEGDRSLDDAAVELVRRWVEAGHPRGTPRPDPERVAIESGFETDVSLDVLPRDGYEPNQTRSDDYRCFVVDWPRDQRGYVTGFRAVPGNRRVAHHAVVFAVTPDLAARYRELESAEEGPGYQCFGGPVPDRLGDRGEREAYETRYPDGVRDLDTGNFWLAHWAPGMDGHVFPDGTGIRLDPGSALVVQMHYYTADAPGERDRETRLDLTWASEVEKPAFHLSQTRNAWLAGERNGSMVIPAGEQATYATSTRLGPMVPYIAWMTGLEESDIRGLEIHSANLHMHAYGHSGVIRLTDQNGRRQTLLSIPRWDLDWQQDFTFAEPKVFPREALDRVSIEVECTYENPETWTVYGGYGSFDEMCFNFSYIAVQSEDARTTESGPSR